MVRELETSASTVANLVAEAALKAETERKEAAARAERLRREEAERRRLDNIKQSRQQLLGLIDDWGTAARVEAFFQDIERRATEGDAMAHEALRNRVQRARELLGGVDALQRFREWKAPDEL